MMKLQKKKSYLKRILMIKRMNNFSYRPDSKCILGNVFYRNLQSEKHKAKGHAISVQQ